jgi:hypothetical protein
VANLFQPYLLRVARMGVRRRVSNLVAIAEKRPLRVWSGAKSGGQYAVMHNTAFQRCGSCYPRLGGST